jgi:hypothetical protein
MYLKVIDDLNATLMPPERWWQLHQTLEFRDSFQPGAPTPTTTVPVTPAPTATATTGTTPTPTRTPLVDVNITVDGDPGDWQPYSPTLTDPQGDTTGGPHTDMEAVYALSDGTHTYLMFKVYDPPLVEPGTIELRLDLAYGDGEVVRFGSNIRSDSEFWGDLGGENHRMEGIDVAWGEVLEVRIPWTVMEEPVDVRPVFAALWCDVEGQFTFVDTVTP